MKWIFAFALSEPIDCEKDTSDRRNVEFVTSCTKKGQRQITGFKITVEGNNVEKAESDATKKAKNLTSLLSATSGTFSDCSVRGYREIDGTLVCTSATIAYSIRNNAVTDISNDHFQRILNGESPLNGQLMYVRKARLSSKSDDWESVIKYLHLMPNYKNEKLTCLRNLVSHHKLDGKEKVHFESLFPKSEKDSIQFGKNEGFDPSDESHANFIRTQALHFLDEVHGCIRSAVKSKQLQ